MQPAPNLGNPIASLSKRSFSKLASNIATIPLFFIMEAILPRILGPVHYGNYNFASNFFTQILSFFDAGSSNFLATSLAQNPTIFALVAFYLRFCLLLFYLVILGVFSLIVWPANTGFLVTMPWWIIVAAALWAYFMWLSRSLRIMNDALGLTTQSELGRIAVNLGSAAIFLGFYATGFLSIGGVLFQQCATLVALSLAFCYVMRNQWHSPSWRLSKSEQQYYARGFWLYCNPLLITAFFSASIGFAERWLLQIFEGSVQQGYFSLSQKAAMGCFLFVSAITPLIQRELAVAHKTNNTARMVQLMETLGTFVYTVACWFACFSAIEGAAIIRIFGGVEYAGALYTIQIMTLYTAHQAYGQIAGSVFYATGTTKTLRNLSLASLFFGLAVTWLCLAPTHLGGLKLGATGLALKMVGVQFISVNIFLIVCHRLIPFNIGRNFLHQLICPLVFLLLSYGTLTLTKTWGLGDTTAIPRFLCSGILYTVASIAIVFLFPFIAGQTRTTLATQLQRLKTYIKPTHTL